MIFGVRVSLGREYGVDVREGERGKGRGKLANGVTEGVAGVRAGQEDGGDAVGTVLLQALVHHLVPGRCVCCFGPFSCCCSDSCFWCAFMLQSLSLSSG